ncbi:dihydrofolate reductase [Methylococcus sp. ANG]|uniref:dihydrofolate reductase n=1 Tax=Methylococcus sp. ANG TaxID=3231903 RepID=UPI00345900CC
MTGLPDISIIVAMAQNRVIGANNAMPWHLSADLKRFRALTLGKPILMGRKTHESIGRPLPGRQNIVLTRSVDFSAPGCTVVHDLGELAAVCAGAAELMVIGGSAVYQVLLPQAKKLYLTLIHHDYAGDTFFPEFAASDWREIGREDIRDDPDFPWPYSYVVLERASPESCCQ